jgi:serine/threonine-protein kinase
MQYKSPHSPLDTFGKWELLNFIDGGGNGEVWKARGPNGDLIALKLLKKLKKKAYDRFRDEITAVIDNSDIKGVLPILDFHLPESIAKETPWYVMPLAIPFTDYVKGKTTTEIIESIIVLAEELSKLHQRKVFHRDIKPANLFFYNDYPCLGDFGLVDFPDKKELTSKRENVGPKWTIAPEMKRNAYTADGEKADSYSFAKTIWILLTKNPLSFDGQYNSTSNIGLNKYLKGIYTKPLDDLLTRSTDNDPRNRPCLNEITSNLKKWKILNGDYQERNKAEWNEIQQILFPFSPPERVAWSNIKDIIDVLNLLAKSRSLNHMFLPNGGGLDLKSACFSSEKDCIELNADDLIYVIKPKRLLFESFQADTQWNYFRLETSELSPLSDKKYVDYGEEPLTEITPGSYTDYECYEYDDFNGKPLPDSARQLVRILRGDFVIFAKTSIYNKVSATYDGRHNKFSSDEFREYINRSASHHSSQQNTSKHDPAHKISYSKSVKIKQGQKLSGTEIKLIESVISIAEKATQEDRELRQKFGIDGPFINPFEEKTIKYAFSERSSENELEMFLDSLSNEEIVLIASVMYAGRDFVVGGRCHTLDEMIAQFSKEEDLKYSIIEKAPLARYLRKGIQAYS